MARHQTSAVVFDWYNTLAAPNPDDFWDRVPELVAEAGGDPDDEAVQRWWHEHPVVHVEHSASEAAYRAWQRQRFAELLDACGLPEPARTSLLDRVDADRYSRSFDAFEDVADVLVSLRSRGVTVGICSNWDWDLDRHLSRNGLTDLLDFVVCSAVHGHRKPHPAIFDTVLAHARTEPASVLFVGDSWHDDIAGSTAAGMRAVHIARHGRCPEEARAVDHELVPCVPDARAVLDLL